MKWAWVLVLWLGCRSSVPAPPPEPKFTVLKVPSSLAVADTTPLLVLLHGFGANERDLVPLAQSLSSRFEVWAVRGPRELGGDRAAWFSLQPSTEGPKVDPAEVEHARTQLAAWLKARAPRPVYLLGFSQGATMSLSIALSEPTLIKGAVAIAGRVPANTPVTKGAGPAVLILQGTRDAMIAPANAESAEQSLQQAGRTVERQSFDAAHEITPAMRQAFEAWLATH